MTKILKLERSLAQHANGVPNVIAAGSNAQIVFCIADAKKDIATLARVFAETLEKARPFVEIDALDDSNGGQAVLQEIDQLLVELGAST